MPDDDVRLPQVSVIVRTHNRPTHLEAALRDIAEQTFDDVEVVIVDDGDVPGAVDDIVGRAGALRERIRVVDRTGGPHGRARAANAGLRVARGALIVLHDDDDTWDPGFLATTVAYLDEHPASVAVSARTDIVRHVPDPAGGPDTLERLPLNPELTAITIPDMLRANRVTTHSLLYRASVHDEIGYLDESLVVHEDWEFYLRLIARHPIDLLPFPALAFWHHRPSAGGDEGNSVFELSDEHLAAHAKVEDDLMRDTFARIGLGTSLHLANEMRRRDEQRAEDRLVIIDLRQRIETAARQLAELRDIAERLERANAQLAALVVDRTSVSSSMRRLTGLFRRPGKRKD